MCISLVCIDLRPEILQILTKGHIPYNADLSAGMHIRDIVRWLIDIKGISPIM